MNKDQVVMTAGELKRLKVWSEVCRRNQWREAFLDGMIGEDMRFTVDSDLLGSVTNFIVIKQGMYLKAFAEEEAMCQWTELEEEAVVFDSLDERAIQKAFRNSGHGSVTGRLV